jgi:hypothetical protein
VVQIELSKRMELRFHFAYYLFQRSTAYMRSRLRVTECCFFGGDILRPTLHQLFAVYVLNQEATSEPRATILLGFSGWPVSVAKSAVDLSLGFKFRSCPQVGAARCDDFAVMVSNP